MMAGHSVRARAPAGDIVAVDWLGQPITQASCQACAYQYLKASGGCEIGHACMQDGYARRIDRFFRWHPELAKAQFMVQQDAHAGIEAR